tara:strand:+ start:2404 stop:2991 length:588 start_codon:yes stop_codon:yes gene_type:complete
MVRKIIVVGNGEGVLNKKNGELIDSFDVVVRLGRYVTEGFEEFVGSRTDIISTIYWKLDNERLKNTKVILNVPLNLKESFVEGQEYIDREFSNSKNNIIYINKVEDIDGLINMYTNILPAFTNINNINFSLGFKTIYFLKKLFPEDDIYTTGFDFFKTGWYWDPAHNRDDSNMHPYTWERLWYARSKKVGFVNEI